jgi:hypothetical protein
MHRFKGQRFGKIGIIFKLKILKAARRTFTEMPMYIFMKFPINIRKLPDITSLPKRTVPVLFDANQLI